jgi:hypothetical protein
MTFASDQESIGNARLPRRRSRKTVTVGFGHNTVLGIAEKVIQAVKNKEIKENQKDKPMIGSPPMPTQVDWPNPN